MQVYPYIQQYCCTSALWSTLEQKEYVHMLWKYIRYLLQQTAVVPPYNPVAYTHGDQEAVSMRSPYYRYHTAAFGSHLFFFSLFRGLWLGYVCTARSRPTKWIQTVLFLCGPQVYISTTEYRSLADHYVVYEYSSSTRPPLSMYWVHGSQAGFSDRISLVG